MQLKIYSLLGKETRTLVDRGQPSGQHEAVWDGLTSRGNRAGPGVYICRLTSAHGCETEKILVDR